MKARHLLALAPPIALLASGWVANRVEPRVLGLPFLLVWIAGWVVLTSVIMGVIYRLDRRPPTS
jgi:hypothetical protein